jgi:membrane peptidoglycan carboxypeptidase
MHRATISDVDTRHAPETPPLVSANRPQGRPARPARPRRHPGRSTASAIALIVFLFLAGVGAIGAFAAVGTYTTLAQDLPDPADLTTYVLPEETIVYDRTGEVELARFGDYQREVVEFEEIPPLVIDATTAVEDKTFWENAGFDPLGIVAAGLDSIRGDSRGGSTITQQLVRARLLDEELVQDADRTIERKLKEIIQSVRVTQEFDGEGGKEAIITAYLNQNYYGNQTYGVKAAYERYFGKPFTAENVTPSEAALLAALPKSPSNYDLVRNATIRCDAEIAEGEECPEDAQTLVVDPESSIIARRDLVLDLLADGTRTPLTGDAWTADDFEAAKDEEVVLANQTRPQWKAPHFVWAVRDELTRKLCGEDAEQTCSALDEGGLRVTTTMDLELQAVAEKWVKLAARVPHRADPEQAARNLGFDELPDWVRNLESKDVHNGAIVALDYQTGELVAYVGSADYYSAVDRPEFQPQYDVVGQGYRQPGSAFKPINVAVGIDDRTFTAGTMLMDVGTEFGGNYTPADADNLERGPVRVRSALQFSLNIPSIKEMALNSPDHVFEKAKEFGLTFQRETTDAGLALALGVAETRPVDLATAYGTLANDGRHIGNTTILTVKDRSGEDVVDPYVPPDGEPVVSEQAAFITTDILRENTIRRVNPFWGRFQIRDANDDYRPATLKTGTNNDAKDLNAYGYIAPPTEDGRAEGAYALVVGVWNGNSDNTPVSTPERPVFSIDIATYVWDGYLSEVSADWPITEFEAPDGLTRATIDPFTGFLASGDGVDEWYIPGTEPTRRLGNDVCGEDVIREVGVEDGFDEWMSANRDWMRRAQRGAGVSGGPDDNPTSYFYNNGFTPYGRTWGAVVDGDGCGEPSPTPTCFPIPTPDASGVIPSFEVPTPSGSEIAALPCPTPSGLPSESPSGEPSPSVEPTPTEEPPPTEEPTPEPTEEPPPTEEPTPEPTEEPPPPTEEPPPESTPAP